MPLSLYDATIPSALQLLGSLASLLDKAEAWCATSGKAPSDLVEARLAPDMLPLSFQVRSAAVHSVGAIEGVRKGSFSPDRAPLPKDFAGLRTNVTDAVTSLRALDPAEVESFIGRDVLFEFGDLKLPFTAENFLLSFSQPNFYFHVTTAYDILRAKGMPIGKRDFMGRLRIKR